MRTSRTWAESCEENGSVELKDQLADRLHAVAQRAKTRLKVPRILERTRNGIKASQVVGIISAPGATLEILPKIDGEDAAVRKALVRMLAVAQGLRVADGELTGLGTQRSDLLEVLIGLFANRLLTAVRRGLPRRYIGQKEDLQLLRGRLNVVRQVTRFAARPDMLACRFDELSEDTPLNRVFKAAVRRLALVTRSAANARLLAELAARLEVVGDSAAPLKEPVRLDRTNTAFHDLHRLACLLLSGDWQSMASGQSLGFSLLFPMHELFERFVGRCLLRAMARCPVDVDLQKRPHSALQDDEGPLFNLQPDVVIETQAGPIVLDTKWKVLKPENGRKLDVGQADVYQMLTYGQAYRAKRLVLLYPWHSGLEERFNRRWQVVVCENQHLEIATVDVGNPSGAVNALREIVGVDGASR